MAVDTGMATRERERFAWRVVLAGFAVFCLLLTAAPLGLRWYLRSAMSIRPAGLEIIRGTVLYTQAGGRQETSANSKIRLGEGDQIRTAPDSKALVNLFDGSNILLWPDTTLRVDRIRSSAHNGESSVIVLNQRTGHSRVEVAPPSTAARQFSLRTPQVSSLLREGSYGVDVSESRSDLSVRRGSVTVTSDEQSVEVLPGERSITGVGQAPGHPRRAADNLLVNGDFGNGLDGWQSGNRNVEDNVAGEISTIYEEGRNIVRLLRPVSTKHAETYIHQAIDRDVSDLQSLKISLHLKLLRQSLSGGGWLGSEYPIAVHLRYRDAAGNENTWVRGFYYQNDESRPTTHGQAVEQGTWEPYAASLFDPNQIYPQPARLLWIEIEASGWEYESLVTDVQIIGE